MEFFSFCCSSREPCAGDCSIERALNVPAVAAVILKNWRRFTRLLLTQGTIAHGAMPAKLDWSANPTGDAEQSPADSTLGASRSVERSQDCSNRTGVEIDQFQW